MKEALENIELIKTAVTQLGLLVAFAAGQCLLLFMIWLKRR